MDAFTLYRNAVERVPDGLNMYGGLNLSDISIKPSELIMSAPNNTMVIAPGLLSKTRETSPIQSPASSHGNPLDMTSTTTRRAPESSKNRGQQSSASRKGRRKRPRATPAKLSMTEADQRRAKALAQNRVAANRYRLRQKEYVENLELRCKEEIEQRQIKSSLVKSLQQEIIRLNDEIIRQSSQCNCIRTRGQLGIRDRLYAQLSA
jgi:hypothetical protein